MSISTDKPAHLHFYYTFIIPAKHTCIFMIRKFAWRPSEQQGQEYIKLKEMSGNFRYM